MLTCDGEASPSFVRQRRAKLNKELEAVGVLLGLPGLTENEGWDIVTRYDHIQESTQTEAEAAK
jgi:hypothetical protein